MAVTVHVVTDNGAIENVEGGEERRGAMAFVVVRHRAGAARLHRQAWLGAVERLDLALLVDREDNGMGGRIDVEADNVFELLGELRIVRQFKRPDAMRGELVGRKDALHHRKLTPAAFASIRPVQWVASPGGGPSARSTTRCTVSGGSGGLPGLRVLSRASPSTPSAMNRACHRHTTGFDLPDRRMISAGPTAQPELRRRD